MRKPITRIFVFGQTMDILTTMVGISLFPTIVEGNPFAKMLLITTILKIIIVYYISIILEQKDFSRFAWFIPMIPVINTAWNIAVIFLEKVG